MPAPPAPSSAIFTNDGTFQSKLRASATADLMTLQTTAGAPEPTSAMEIVSDPLLPDRNVIDRLGHIDPELYNLADTSHLMRLLTVLLGGAGAGGLRKQIAIARLQNSFRGMHFLDLDRFYGALFGIRRTKAELMPDFGTLTVPAVFNPYRDAAGSDAWDDVHSRDASYRARLIKFAKALPLGGTYAGLRAAAEALLNVECELYESWTWVDEQNFAAAQPPLSIYTWTSVTQTYITWDAVAKNHTWSNLTGSGGTNYFLGRTGQKNRSELVIQPKRQIREDEHFQAVRVLNTIKPAGAQITIDPGGLAIHQQVPIRNVAADSEYWEVIYKTTPAPLVDPSPTQPVYIEPDPHKCQPRPAFSSYQGERWCYNNDVVRCVSYEKIEDAILTATNFATVVFNDGSRRDYLTSHSLLDGMQVLAARVISDGVMTSLPYAGRVNFATIKNVAGR